MSPDLPELPDRPDIPPNQLKEEVKALERVKAIDNPNIFASPRTDGQNYKGEILHIDEERGYCVQLSGKKTVYVHKLERLNDVPDVGQNVQISYPKDQSQEAQVKVLEQKQRRSQHL